jgi:hypothetical protein
VASREERARGLMQSMVERDAAGALDVAEGALRDEAALAPEELVGASPLLGKTWRESILARARAIREGR